MSQHRIRFTKMHGLGNDFVVIDAINQKIDSSSLPVAMLGNRHTGIGFDQLLIIEPSTKAAAYCRIYNSDGTEAEQCGNGLRCVARFLHENGHVKTDSFSIETKAGVFAVDIKDYDNVRVMMGVPTVVESLIPIKINGEPNETFISVLNLGNPHAVLKVTGLEQTNAGVLASAISSHAYFPHGANVGFMEIIEKDHVRLRTFERGAGETLACGSNACAAAIAGISNDWLASSVQVEFSQGSLWIEWQGNGKAVYQTGPAAVVFSGEL